MALWPLLINHPPWVHPQGCVIEESWAEHRYKGDALLLLSEDCCCDRSSSIYLSNVVGIRQACKLFLSLLCGLFNPLPSPVGDWLANQLKDSSTDQYLSSLSLPELPIHVTGVPIPLAGTNARTCRAVWGPLTEVIHYYQLEHPLIHYRWTWEFAGKLLHL